MCPRWPARTPTTGSAWPEPATTASWWSRRATSRDSSIAAAIVDATDRHVRGAQHELRTGASRRPAPRPPPRSRALSTPRRTRSCWSPRRPTRPAAEQGDPANVLQPAGTGPNLTARARARRHRRRLHRAPGQLRRLRAARSRSPRSARSSPTPAAARPGRSRRPGSSARFPATRPISRSAHRGAAAGPRSAPATATPTSRAPRWRPPRSPRPRR